MNKIKTKPTRPPRGRDQVSAIGPDGIESNCFLYELVEEKDTPEMRENFRKDLIKLGFSEEEARRISTL